MHNWLLVGLGGAFGSMGRYACSQFIIHTLESTFPFSTLIVNSLGSFLIGFLAIALQTVFKTQTTEWHLLLVVGFLGGFTTFSAFSLETLQLFQSQHYSTALLNIIANLLISLSAVFLGFSVAKSFFT